MWNGCVLERDRDEIFSRDLRCLLNGDGNVSALGNANANASLMIPDHDRGAKAKTAASLDHARDTRQIKHLLIELAFFPAPPCSLVAFSCHNNRK